MILVVAYLYKVITAFTIISGISFVLIAHFTTFLGTLLKLFLDQQNTCTSPFSSRDTLLPFFLAQKEHQQSLSTHNPNCNSSRFTLSRDLFFACFSSLILLYNPQFIRSPFSFINRDHHICLSFIWNSFSIQNTLAQFHYNLHSIISVFT